jgi:hypothetical protein
MNENFEKFWLSFNTWMHKELPESPILKNKYKHYDNLDGGTYYIYIDFERLYLLHYGSEWVNFSEGSNATIETFKPFIEVIYEECIEDRYQFTVSINDRLRKFKVPYRLQNGKFVREGYKTTTQIEKIINYEMCERKIRFSEEMISSREPLDKKVALDYIVDALQYLISIAEGETIKNKYQTIALNIAGSQNNKIYAVILEEIDEVMKISNEYFDIRHNEYLNKSKEKREPLSDMVFIEYMYNRVYALVYVIRLKCQNLVKER